MVATIAIAAPASATFPGQNGRILFSSDRDGTVELYTMNPDGSDQTRLPNGTGGFEARWSPDGSRIAFVRSNEVWAINADGSGLANLTASAASDISPTWSPDGTKIAFSSCCRDNGVAIWVMNADGSAQARLTAPLRDAYELDWSPDGTKIAFVGVDDFGEADYQLHIATVADGSVSQLTTGGDAAQGPSWSPDGTKIAFNKDRDDLENNPCGCYDIVVMNADGTGQTRLMETFQGEYAPVWSPDGTKIAFGDGNTDISVMNPDGSDQTPLATLGLNIEPDWQRIPVGPGQPATLLLSPETATNTLDQDSHCVTATVTDASGDPTPGITVTFTVTGATSASGSEATDANGEAQFCYQAPELPGTDQITATVEPDGPSDTATKTWVVPASTDGCGVTSGGRITAQNDDPATFSDNPRAQITSDARGRIRYTDHGPAEPLAVKSTSIDALVCEGRQATVFGHAGSIAFRVDENDRGQPGRRDTYRIVLSTGYDSGTQTLDGGNIRVRGG